MWCMNTRDTMTVRFSEILYHTLGQKHLTGQGMLFQLEMFAHASKHPFSEIAKAHPSGREYTKREKKL